MEWPNRASGAARHLHIPPGLFFVSLPYHGLSAWRIPLQAHEIHGCQSLFYTRHFLSLIWVYSQVTDGDITSILIPWETAVTRRRKRDREEILACVGGYAKSRMAELVTVGEDEIPDDFLGFAFLP